MSQRSLKVNLSVEIPLEGLGARVEEAKLPNLIHSTMMDALYEFYRHREISNPPSLDARQEALNYVDQRYPTLTEKYRVEKRDEVLTRCRLADKIRRGVTRGLEVVVVFKADEEDDV